ncbi:MAG TPA: hypothetical protein VF435_03295 [Pyrinomonadaceae bacterium]
MRDRKNTRLLRQQGLVVMRAWEHSIRNEKTLQQFIKKVERALTQRARGDAFSDPP